MARLLIYTDSPCLYSGLARCGRELASRLSKEFELAYAGWHHQPKPHQFPYFIYPVGKQSQHENRELEEILFDFEPDFCLAIGDIWNFSALYSTFFKFKEANQNFKLLLWLTIDGENLYEPWKEILTLADDVNTFSNFAKNELFNFAQIETTTIYPGIDKNVFKPLEIDLDTRTNLPFQVKDTFLVLNINQNTDRKHIPLTIEAFRDFAEDKADVFLLLVTDPQDPYGYDLWDLINKLKIKKKVAITKEAGPRRGMSDAKLNLIYNIASVSVNTSIGEGLSLPTLEAMAVGLPVVATDYAAMSELLEQGGGLKLKVASYMYGFNGIRRAIIDKNDLVEKFNLLYNDFKDRTFLRNEIGKKGKEFTDSLSWDKTAEIFVKKIKDLSVEKKLPFVKQSVKVKDLRPLVVIPSWGTHCGIAEYTRSLYDATRNLGQSVVVFPSKQYEEIPALVKQHNYNIIHLQHEYSFFQDRSILQKLLEALAALDVRTILTLHSLVPGLVSYNEMLFSHLDAIIVHCDYFKRTLEKDTLERSFILEKCPIEVIEMGCGNLIELDQKKIKETKRNLEIEKHNPIIGSFGFLRDQKGFQEIVEAVKMLKTRYLEILLLLICPPHEFGSKVYDDKFFKFVEQQDIANNILIIREYLSEEKLLRILQCADLFILNYKDSPAGGGISAAIKTLFRVQRPIIVHESIAFADLETEVARIKSSEATEIANAVARLLVDNTTARNLVQSANEFVIRNSWENVAKKHLELYAR